MFLLAWGSDTLTYRPPDLANIRQWTVKKPDWPDLFKKHHSVRPKAKGKPTFHLVCQMQGEHAYKRRDARAALIEGLGGKIPATWHLTDENAWVEVWLTIRGKTAVCGVRLSDRTMRHRTYKEDHVLASLRPTVAAAMVRLAGVGPGMTILDPMCGAGTILAEAIQTAGQRRGAPVTVLGGDVDPNAMFVTGQNLDRVGPATLVRWDARRLPLPTASVDRIVSNPPFGKQLETPDLIPPLYAAAAARVAAGAAAGRPGGVPGDAEEEPLLDRAAAGGYGWQKTRGLPVRVLGQRAALSVWRKPDAGGSV